MPPAKRARTGEEGSGSSSSGLQQQAQPTGGQQGPEAAPAPQQQPQPAPEQQLQVPKAGGWFVQPPASHQQHYPPPGVNLPDPAQIAARLAEHNQEPKAHMIAMSHRCHELILNRATVVSIVFQSFLKMLLFRTSAKFACCRFLFSASPLLSISHFPIFAFSAA